MLVSSVISIGVALFAIETQSKDLSVATVQTFEIVRKGHFNDSNLYMSALRTQSSHYDIERGALSGGISRPNKRPIPDQSKFVSSIPVSLPDTVRISAKELSIPLLGAFQLQNT